MVRWYLRRETLLLLAVVALGATTLLAIWAMQPTRLTVAVGPTASGEARIVEAIARTLVAKNADLRLKVMHTNSMRASALALQDGRADLAVVRPDVLLPRDSASIAVLHDQALLVVAPAAAKLDTILQLGGKRLGLVERDAADLALLPRVLGYYGLRLREQSASTPLPPNEVSVVRLLPKQITSALAARQVDVLATVAAPNSAEARQFVRDVQGPASGTAIAFIGGIEGDGITTRLPELKPITIPAGAFAGGPPLPAKEVKTIGTPYLVMARADLARGTVSDLTRLIFTLRPDYGANLPETSAIRAPEFENASAATTARVPVHPGALDYLNREQRGFMERYGDFLYLGGLMFGLIGSGIAWIRERVARLRHEYVDDVLDRLAAIATMVQASESRDKLDALTSEIDQLAIDVVRDLRDRGGGTAALSAVDIVLDAARSRVGGRREALARIDAERAGVRAPAN